MRIISIRQRVEAHPLCLLHYIGRYDHAMGCSSSQFVPQRASVVNGMDIR